MADAVPSEAFISLFNTPLLSISRTGISHVLTRPRVAALSKKKKKLQILMNKLHFPKQSFLAAGATVT